MITPPFKTATLAERESFYEKEFSIKKIKRWFNNKKPQLCAIDAGTDTNIIKNKSWNNTLFYFYFDE